MCIRRSVNGREARSKTVLKSTEGEAQRQYHQYRHTAPVKVNQLSLEYFSNALIPVRSSSHVLCISPGCIVRVGVMRA